MRCPRDGTEIEPLEYVTGVFVDTCPRCRGVWLDKGELEKIEAAHEHDHTEELSKMPDLIKGAYVRARQRADEAVSCPVCGLEAETAEYAYCSQIMIDRCPRCGGIWLDRGELDALEVFYERSRKESRSLRLAFLMSLLRNERG